MDIQQSQELELLTLTTHIVASHVAKTEVPTSELTGLIETVYTKLTDLSEFGTPNALTPAVPVEDSVTPDFLICLEDGKKFKMLKKHIMASYGLTPEEYRAKWNLTPDYPMVAPNYATLRQELAKQTGLGKSKG